MLTQLVFDSILNTSITKKDPPLGNFTGSNWMRVSGGSEKNTQEGAIIFPLNSLLTVNDY